MFKTIKKLLGVVPTDEQETDKEAIEKVEKAERVKTVTVKPKEATTAKPKRMTRKSLGTLTKLQIDELAAEMFGVELDRRKTKTAMIEEFMAAQKKAK